MYYKEVSFGNGSRAKQTIIRNEENVLKNIEIIFGHIWNWRVYEGVDEWWIGTLRWNH